MTNLILVCPFDAALISRLHGHALAVRVQEASAACQARDSVEKRSRLHCILLESSEPLSELALGEEMKGIPLAVFVPGTGDLGALFEKLPLLQALRMQVYLPLSGTNTIRDIRILSSLGIATALVWDAASVDWDAVEDLLAYAAYTRVPHATIEPFSYLIAGYSARNLVDFSAVSFDDPSRYLHVSSDGRVARSGDDLRAGRFLGDLDSLDAMTDRDRLEDYRARTDHFFLEQEGCAFCSAFRVCLGKFSNRRTANPGCERLFAKLMDIAESTGTKDSHALWQP
jgi:hypothetical protein